MTDKEIRFFAYKVRWLNPTVLKVKARARSRIWVNWTPIASSNFVSFLRTGDVSISCRSVLDSWSWQKRGARNFLNTVCCRHKCMASVTVTNNVSMFKQNGNKMSGLLPRQLFYQFQRALIINFPLPPPDWHTHGSPTLLICFDLKVVLIIKSGSIKYEMTPC